MRLLDNGSHWKGNKKSTVSACTQGDGWVFVLSLWQWKSLSKLLWSQVSACYWASVTQGHTIKTWDKTMKKRSVPRSAVFLGTPWCAPIKIKHGDVSCRTPRGEHYRNVMGTRCKIRCKQGYEAQSSEVVCMASKHWSSNYACRGEKVHLNMRTHCVSHCLNAWMYSTHAL